MRKKRPKPVWDPKLVLWEVPDAAWARIEPVLEERCPPASTGRPRTVDFRVVLNAIIFRLRSGCQWNREVRRRQPGPPLVPTMGQTRRFPTCLGRAPSGMRGTRRRQLDLAIRRRVHEQGPFRRGKKGDRIRPTGPSREPRKAFWSKPTEDLWQSPSTARTRLTASCWRPPSTPSSSSVRSRRRSNNTCASTRDMTIPRARTPPVKPGTSPTSGALARRRRISADTSARRLGDGWWSGRWRGSRSVGPSSCAMTSTGKTTWR